MLFIADTARGRFYAGGALYPMAIGKAGAVPASNKREGDGKTPFGRYRVEHGYYRADRMVKPSTGAALKPVNAADGWCDAPGHTRYNSHVTLPDFAASHEVLHRADCLYDLVFVLNHNRWPAVPGYGSAIFLHVAKEAAGGLKPTQGCLALRRDDLLTVANAITHQSWLIIR